jgi:serine/threonine protein kinase
MTNTLATTIVPAKDIAFDAFSFAEMSAMQPELIDPEEAFSPPSSSDKHLFAQQTPTKPQGLRIISMRKPSKLIDHRFLPKFAGPSPHHAIIGLPSIPPKLNPQPDTTISIESFEHQDQTFLIQHIALSSSEDEPQKQNSIHALRSLVHSSQDTNYPPNLQRIVAHEETSHHLSIAWQLFSPFRTQFPDKSFPTLKSVFNDRWGQMSFSRNPLWVAETISHLLQALAYLKRQGLTLTSIEASDIDLHEGTQTDHPLAILNLVRKIRFIPPDQSRMKKQQHEAKLIEDLKGIFAKLCSRDRLLKHAFLSQTMEGIRLDALWLRYRMDLIENYLQPSDNTQEPLPSSLTHSIRELHHIRLQQQKRADDEKLFPLVYTQRFNIGDQLGKGGIGTIYHAFDHRSGQQIAIKQILTQDLFNPPTKYSILRSGLLMVNQTEDNRLPETAMKIFGIYEMDGIIVSLMELIHGSLPAFSPHQPAYCDIDEIGEGLQKRYRKETLQNDILPSSFSAHEILSPSQIASILLQQLSTIRSLLDNDLMATDVRNQNFLISQAYEAHHRGPIHCVLSDYDNIVSSKSFKQYPLKDHRFRTRAYYLPEACNSWECTPDIPNEKAMVYTLGLNLLYLISMKYPRPRESISAHLQEVEQGLWAQRFLDHIPTCYASLKSLAKKMIAAQPKHRTSLQDIEQGLREIIGLSPAGSI